ncbi:MAG: ACT domain-containing protein [bacterium]
MRIKILKEDFVVVKLENLEEVNIHDEFCFISKTDEELSLVCTSRFTPTKCLDIQKGYRAFRINEKLDFNLIGVVAKITSLLALNEISVFVVSTFNTDYFLVKNAKLGRTMDILIANNYEIENENEPN